MGLIKKAAFIGGVYYIAKKVTENKQQQNGHCPNQQAQTSNNNQQQFPQQSQFPQQPTTSSRSLDQQPLPASVPQQQPVIMSGHASYCNGSCGGQCSFNASEQYGYEAAKAPMYQEQEKVY